MGSMARSNQHGLTGVALLTTGLAILGGLRLARSGDELAPLRVPEGNLTPEARVGNRAADPIAVAGSTVKSVPEPAIVDATSPLPKSTPFEGMSIPDRSDKVVAPEPTSLELFRLSLEGHFPPLDISKELEALRSPLGVPLAAETFVREWYWIKARVAELGEQSAPRLSDAGVETVAAKALQAYLRYEIQWTNSTKDRPRDCAALARRVDGLSVTDRLAVYEQFQAQFVSQINQFIADQNR